MSTLSLSKRDRLKMVDVLVLKYGTLFLGIILSGVLVLGGDSIWSGVAGQALLVAVALGLSKMELMHPYTWYVPLLFLYSASVPVLIGVGVREDIGSLRQTVFVEWIAMVFFLLFVGPPIRRHKPRFRPLVNITVPARVIFYTALFLSALYMYGIWSSGLTSKFAIALSNSPFLRLNAAFSVLALSFAVLLADSLLRRKLPWFFVPFTIGWVLLAFVYSGERALIFRIIWIILFISHAVYRQITPKMLLAMAASGLILVSILANFKARYLDDTYDYSTSATAPLDETYLAQIVFSDEFVTASENLQVLIQAAPWPWYFGETLWWDFKQVMLLGARTGPAPTSYFNSYFFPDVVARGGGRGFTLVGEGYMNFGTLGAALWFAILGLFVRFLYKKSQSGVLWLIVYIASMPTIAYATRADFSNILSPFIKHVIGPVVVILLLRRILTSHRPFRSSDCRI